MKAARAKQAALPVKLNGGGVKREKAGVKQLYGSQAMCRAMKLRPVEAPAPDCKHCCCCVTCLGHGAQLHALQRKSAQHFKADSERQKQIQLGTLHPREGYDIPVQPCQQAADLQRAVADSVGRALPACPLFESRPKWRAHIGKPLGIVTFEPYMAFTAMELLTDISLLGFDAKGRGIMFQIIDHEYGRLAARRRLEEQQKRAREQAVQAQRQKRLEEQQRRAREAAEAKRRRDDDHEFFKDPVKYTLPYLCR